MATTDEIARLEAKLASGTLRPEKDPQADVSEGWGGRTIPRESDLDALTPAGIKTLLLNAEAGDIAAQCELFELMEERDGELAAHLRTRKAGVLSCDWTIEPPDETPEAARSVELCQEVIDGLPNIQDALMDLMDAVGKGFSVLETTWQTTRAEWRPINLTYRPQRWFTLAEDGQTFLIRGDVGDDDAPMNPLNFVVHRVRAKSGFEWQTSLLRSCVRAFIVRFYSWKDWMALAEVYGMPPRIGILREGVAWDSREATALWSAVQSLGQDYAAVIQGDNKVEFPAVQHGEGAIYEAILDRAGRELVLAILGQVLTSGGESGGSYALGQVHNQVRWDLIETDAKALERTLTQQLLQPIVLLNRGPGYPVPSWNIVVEQPEDLGELSTTVETLVKSGARIPMSWVHETFGIPEPEAGEEVLVAPAVAALASPVQAPNSAAATAVQNAPNSTILNQLAEEPPVGIVPEDGLKWLGERRVADEAAWEALSPAGRQRAWYVTGLGQESTARLAQQLVATFKAGETANEFLGRIEALGLGVPGGETPAEGQISAGHARLVERQNRYAAYAADRWIKAQRLIEQRPYGQYHTAGDENVRASHAAFDGLVKPLDDPFWSAHTPPWEFNCRCTFTTISQDELEAEGLHVADEAEEAARYQAALLLQDQVYGPAEFEEAVRRLTPEMARRENLRGLKVQPNPDWTFDRNDAHGLESEGWAPRTEEGRRDAAILRRLPRVGADVRGPALAEAAEAAPEPALPDLVSDLTGDQIEQALSVIDGLPKSASSAVGARNRQSFERALVDEGWDQTQAHALAGAIDRWAGGAYDSIRKGNSARAREIQARLQDLAAQGRVQVDALHRGLEFRSTRERSKFMKAFEADAQGEIPYLQSFSTDEAVGADFASAGLEGDYGVLVHLRASEGQLPGLAMRDLSTIPDEEEVITPAALRYAVAERRTRTINGRQVIELTLDWVP